jgi:hypothetical protein
MYLQRVTRRGKDWLIVAYSVLFRGLIAAIYEIWAAKYYKGQESTVNVFA